MKRYTVLGDGGKKMLDGKDPYKCRKWQLRVNVLDGERGGKEAPRCHSSVTACRSYASSECPSILPVSSKP